MTPDDSKMRWERVLESIYENGGLIEVSVDVDESAIGGTGIQEQYEAAYQRLEDISGVDLGEQGDRTLIESLVEWELIEVEGESNYALIRLTKAGFEVVHDIQVKRRQFTINKGILLVGLLSTVGFFLSKWPPEGVNPLASYNIEGFAVGLIVAIILVLWIGFELYKLQSIFELSGSTNRDWFYRGDSGNG